MTYNDLIKKIDSFDIGWEVRKSELDINGVFGRSVLLIFTKSQVLSGFGAAIGKLKDSKVIDGFETIKHNVNNIKLSSDINCTLDSVMINLLTKLDNIKK